jgi:hypothetical protein
LPSGVAAAIAAILIVVFKIETGTPLPPFDPQQAALSLGAGLQFGWLASVAGLRVGAETAPHLLALAALAIDAIVVLVVVASLRRNRASAWLWLGMLVTTFVSIAIIASQRAVEFGVWNTVIGRYHTDSVFITLAATAMAFGGAYLSKPTRAPHTARAALLGLAVVAFQIQGGIDYPYSLDPVGNRRFVETFEADAAHLSAGQSVANRMMPERITPHWIRPWNSLAQFAPTLPTRPPIAGWDAATHYMDDNGELHAIADLPTLALTDVDGGELVLALAPTIEHAGHLDTAADGRASGWFNLAFAPADKVRIAIVSGDRILAWADRADRPDVSAVFRRAMRIA